MSNLNRHPVRRTAAGVLASALAFSGAFAAGSPAFATPTFALDRLAGADRYETSAAIAAQFGAADGAILASGEAGHIVDALSASFLAGVRMDPVLLTSRGAVSAQVLAQLNALTNKRVTIVGGEMAVSEAVATQLRNAGFTVTRLAGVNRYETSEAIIRAGVAEGEESKVGILVSGQSPVDALAAGALAYKGDHPVFLTAGGTIPEATLDAMQAAGTTSVIIVGGTTVVPETVRAQLTARNITVVTRLGGVDRSATSRLVADYLITNHGFSATTFNVASGANNGVDALSGAALSGKTNTVLLVTNTATDPGSVDDFATARAATLTTAGRIFGGEAVVAPAVETQLENAGGAGVSNQAFSITPNTGAALVFVAPNPDTAATDDRVYTVNNAVVGTVHQIRLVPAANVTVGADGRVTFLENGTTNQASFGNVAADITAVNGVANTAGGASATITPTAATFTFRVDGEADETVVPIVFFDQNNNGQLDLDANNAPLAAEAFGVGGATNFNPPEAAVGGLTVDATIGEVDKAANTIVTSAGTVRYDDNDVFHVVTGTAGNQAGPAATLANRVTAAQFEAQLSTGDELDEASEYARESGFSSTFVLEDITPLAPTGLAVTGRTSSSVTLTLNGVSSGATVRVHGEADPADPSADVEVTTADPVLATSSTDASPDAGFQITVSGLTAATTYDLAAVQIVDGEESALSTEVNDVTTQAVGESVRPTVASATVTTEAGLVGIADARDVLTLRFSKGMAATTATAGLFLLTDADGDTVQVLCESTATAGNDVTTATCALTDADGVAGAETLTLTLLENADDTNAAGNGTFSYPATITTTNVAVADTAGNVVDLAGSADRTIG